MPKAHAKETWPVHTTKVIRVYSACEVVPDQLSGEASRARKLA